MKKWLTVCPTFVYGGQMKPPVGADEKVMIQLEASDHSDDRQMPKLNAILHSGCLTESRSFEKMDHD